MLAKLVGDGIMAFVSGVEWRCILVRGDGARASCPHEVPEKVAIQSRASALCSSGAGCLGFRSDPWASKATTPPTTDRNVPRNLTPAPGPMSTPFEPKRFVRRTAVLLAAGWWLLAHAVPAAEPAPAEDRFVLWDPARSVPTSAEAPLLEGVEFVVVKPRVPEVDGYNWLHGAAACWHGATLYASFGHNRGSENTASEVANGRASADGGKTWGPLFAIDDGDTANPAVSHGVFLSHRGELWAFHGSFYDRMRKVHARAYVLDEPTGRWEARGVVAENGFWPLQEPLKMDDGNWIMAGISVAGGYGGTDDPAAVALSHGDDLTRWDVIAIPKPDDLEMWGESTVIVDGPHVLNIARWGRPIALAAESNDYGRTWTEMRQSNLPMAASKPYAGVLSTGRRYLIGTTTADAGNRRSPLTIALSRPGEKVFSTIYRIRDAVCDGPGESDPGCRLSYPYAAEHEGKLYVIYSNDGARGGNRNSCELAIVPLRSLGDGP